MASLDVFFNVQDLHLYSCTKKSQTTIHEMHLEKKYVEGKNL